MLALVECCFTSSGIMDKENNFECSHHPFPAPHQGLTTPCPLIVASLHTPTLFEIEPCPSCQRRCCSCKPVWSAARSGLPLRSAARSARPLPIAARPWCSLVRCCSAAAGDCPLLCAMSHCPSLCVVSHCPSLCAVSH